MKSFLLAIFTGVFLFPIYGLGLFFGSLGYVFKQGIKTSIEFWDEKD